LSVVAFAESSPNQVVGSTQSGTLGMLGISGKLEQPPALIATVSVAAIRKMTFFVA